jgi:hypothetical protein
MEARAAVSYRVVGPSAVRHLRGLHTLVWPPESPLVQRDCQIGPRYLACRAFAVTRRECTVYQTALRNYCGLFPRMAGETSGSSRGCGAVLALTSHIQNIIQDLILRFAALRSRQQRT